MPLPMIMGSVGDDRDDDDDDDDGNNDATTHTTCFYVFPWLNKQTKSQQSAELLS